MTVVVSDSSAVTHSRHINVLGNLPEEDRKTYIVNSFVLAVVDINAVVKPAEKTSVVLIALNSPTSRASYQNMLTTMDLCAPDIFKLTGSIRLLSRYLTHAKSHDMIKQCDWIETQLYDFEDANTARREMDDIFLPSLWGDAYRMVTIIKGLSSLIETRGRVIEEIEKLSPLTWLINRLRFKELKNDMFFGDSPF